MFVCLCHGITCRTVNAAMANGASTSKRIVAVCGAGSECGRCKSTLRRMLAARTASLVPAWPRGKLSVDIPCDHLDDIDEMIV
ncbi:(2Fe-2S)-binding protein [Mycolicibacterium porcinum]|uniref:(2Fe-2S)-binding protein n=1 Tax=Mycolicibacterium porcinum TaxID=39693 RepID=UPI0009F4D06D|nr:(2Fe-2S)-binding protein [Mycolicibacterium porcinum]